MKKKLVFVLCGLLCVVLIVTVCLIGKTKKSYDDYNKPSVNLDEYYESSMQGEISSSGYTSNVYVDAMIDDLINQNAYSTVKVLEDWDDFALNVHTYAVLFDDNSLYYISIDTDNKVFSNPGDYEYYLEMDE